MTENGSSEANGAIEASEDGQQRGPETGPAGGSEAVARGRRRRGWLVTTRDVDWLAFVGRWRFVTAAQVAREFSRRGSVEVSVKVVERRLRAARELGLVTSTRIVADVPSVHSLTREGMALVDMSGPVVGPKLAEFRHDLAVVDLGGWLLASKPGLQLLSERQVRHVDTPNAHRGGPPRYAVMLPEFASTRRRAYPDLVTVGEQGEVWAHELETSRKEHRRLVRLMLAFATAEHVTGVRYYASSNVLAGVEAAAAVANKTAGELGRGRRVSVVPWPVPPPPPPAPADAGAAMPSTGSLPSGSPSREVRS